LELKIKDIAVGLGFSEKKLRHMIARKEIPAYCINNDYYFSRAEIVEWALQHNIAIAAPPLLGTDDASPIILADLIHKGGVWSDMPGDCVSDVLRSAVAKLPLPPCIDREALTFFLIQREELMPTAIGQGVSVPHPRSPIIAAHENEQISVLYLRAQLAVQALDGEPLHTLFLILTANQRRHLEVLARIAQLCRQADFIARLRRRAPAAELIAFIRDQEANWPKTGGRLA
jgi:nitrogen PTS system EIIA component